MTTQKCGDNGNDLQSKKAQLTPLEYRVTQDRQTERPFSNKYYKHWESGTYHCVVCDTQLFRSNTKFESKSGWPAFYDVVDPKRVKLKADLSHVGANLLLLIAKPELARTEVSCSNCNAHLGHLFKDGPKPTGLRYCINSASMKFVGDDDSDYQSDASSIPGNGSSPPQFKKEASTADAKGKKISSLETTTTTTDSMITAPMAVLCLNNQSCQKVSQQKQIEKTDSRSSSSPLPPQNPTPTIDESVDNNNGKSIIYSKESLKPVSSRSSNLPDTSFHKFSSGGCSSVAKARIAFFQQGMGNCSDNSGFSNHNSSSRFRSQPPTPTRWGNKGKASDTNNEATFSNRFVGSSSSGSISSYLKSGNSNESTACKFGRQSSTEKGRIERVTSPPKLNTLRETFL